MRDTSIRAPFDGFVEKRLVNLGELVKTQMPVMAIVRLDRSGHRGTARAHGAVDHQRPTRGAARGRLPRPHVHRLRHAYQSCGEHRDTGVSVRGRRPERRRGAEAGDVRAGARRERQGGRHPDAAVRGAPISVRREPRVRRAGRSPGGARAAGGRAARRSDRDCQRREGGEPVAITDVDTLPTARTSRRKVSCFRNSASAGRLRDDARDVAIVRACSRSATSASTLSKATRRQSASSCACPAPARTKSPPPSSSPGGINASLASTKFRRASPKARPGSPSVRPRARPRPGRPLPRGGPSRGPTRIDRRRAADRGGW